MQDGRRLCVGLPGRGEQPETQGEGRSQQYRAVGEQHGNASRSPHDTSFFAPWPGSNLPFGRWYHDYRRARLKVSRRPLGLATVRWGRRVPRLSTCHLLPHETSPGEQPRGQQKEHWPPPKRPISCRTR
jgi:hypothetical protein